LAYYNDVTAVSTPFGLTIFALLWHDRILLCYRPIAANARTKNIDKLRNLQLIRLQGIIFNEIAKVILWFPVFFTFFAVVVFAMVVCQTYNTQEARLAVRILSLLYHVEGILSTIMYFRTVPGVWAALCRWPCTGSRHKHVRIMTQVEEIEASYFSTADERIRSRDGSFSADAPYVRFTEDFEYDQGDHVALEDVGSETSLRNSTPSRS